MTEAAATSTTVAMPVNPFSAVLNQIIDLIDSGGVAAAKAWLTVNAPILEAPVIGFFTNEVLEALENGLGKFEKVVVDRIVNDVQITGQKLVLVNAGSALTSARRSGDTNAIAIAKQNYIIAQASIVRDDGA